MIKLKTDQSEIEYPCKPEWLRDSATLNNMDYCLALEGNQEDEKLIEIPNCSDMELEKFLSLMKQETEYYLHHDVETMNYFSYLLAKNILDSSLNSYPPVWITSFAKTCSLDLLEKLIYISDFLDIGKIQYLLLELKNRKLYSLNLPNQSGNSKEQSCFLNQIK